MDEKQFNQLMDLIKSQTAYLETLNKNIGTILKIISLVIALSLLFSGCVYWEDIMWYVRRY